MKKISLLLVSIFLVGTSSFAQLKSSEQLPPSGNLHADSKVLFAKSGIQTHSISFPSPSKKSPVIAGLLSLVFPGAGEVYSESYIKGTIFAVAEVSAIVFAITYNKKGDNQTSTFEQYADEHWSIKRYAEWTLNNIGFINSAIDPSKYSVINSDGSVNHSELNRLERDLGAGYSHALPQHGDQQYYELIGKYPQYSHGWDDAKQTDTDFHILSQNFLDYSKMRGKANDYYNYADKAVIGIYVNHFLSGLDAVWSAISFNKDLAVNIRVHPINSGVDVTLIPTITIQYGF